MSAVGPIATEAIALTMVRFRSIPVIRRFSAHTESVAFDPKRHCVATFRRVVSINLILLAVLPSSRAGQRAQQIAGQPPMLWPLPRTRQHTLGARHAL